MKFYQKKRSYRSMLIGMGLAFVVFTGAGCLNTESTPVSQQKLTTEKVDVEQQEKSEVEEKVQLESVQKSEAEKATEAVVSNNNEAASVNSAQKTVNSPIALTKATVTKIVDGDTIDVKLENGEIKRVRFIGVNTPESTTKQEPYGKEASAYTTKQLSGKTVYLEKDVSETDRYGRLLRYIWLEQPKEITESEIRIKMFNAVLALGGYAQQATYPPDVKYADYFGKFAAEARKENKGLWAVSTSQPIATPAPTSTPKATPVPTAKPVAQPSTGEKQYVDANGRGLIKGNINSKKEKIYHIPGSTYYDRTNAEVWFKTESEAKAAGYRAPLR